MTRFLITEYMYVSAHEHSIVSRYVVKNFAKDKIEYVLAYVEPYSSMVSLLLCECSGAHFEQPPSSMLLVGC